MKSAIESVHIVGAGAMGAVYGAKLHDFNPLLVAFIAGGERGTRLRRKGLRVNGKHYSIPVLDPERLSEAADLVIVSVKHHHLDQAIRDMKRAVGSDTLFLSVMNGIESEERIGAVYGMGKVLYAIAVGMDAVRDGNEVKYRDQGRICFGEALNPRVSERVGKVRELFNHAAIACEVPPDMLRMLWWKFMINVGINQTSAVLGGSFRLFQTSGEARALMESAMREVIHVAARVGVSLREDDLKNWYDVLYSLNPDGKTSMLQDVEARRKTEVEMFAGTMIEFGKRCQVPTPVNERLFRQIREIEAGYTDELKEKS
jgi:2-dehydropantoate 2-reductase